LYLQRNAELNSVHFVDGGGVTSFQMASPNTNMSSEKEDHRNAATFMEPDADDMAVVKKILEGKFGGVGIEQLMDFLDGHSALGHIGEDRLTDEQAAGLLHIWHDVSDAVKEATKSGQIKYTAIGESPGTDYLKKMLTLMAKTLTAEERKVMYDAITERYSPGFKDDGTFRKGPHQWIANLTMAAVNMRADKMGYSLNYTMDVISVSPNGDMLIQMGDGRAFTRRAPRAVTNGIQIMKFVELYTTCTEWNVRAINLPPSKLPDRPTNPVYARLPDPENPGKLKVTKVIPAGRWRSTWGADAVFFMDSDVPICKWYNYDLMITGSKVPMQSYDNIRARKAAVAMRSPDPREWKELPKKEIAFLHQEGRRDLLEGNRRMETGYKGVPSPLSGVFVIQKSHDAMNGGEDQSASAMKTSKYPIQNLANPVLNTPPLARKKYTAFVNKVTGDIRYQTHQEINLCTNFKIESSRVDCDVYAYEQKLCLILSEYYVWEPDDSLIHSYMQDYFNQMVKPEEDEMPDSVDVGNYALFDPTGEMMERQDGVEIHQPRPYVPRQITVPAALPIVPQEPVPLVQDDELEGYMPSDENLRLPVENYYRKVSLLDQLCKNAGDQGDRKKCLEDLNLQQFVDDLRHTVRENCRPRFDDHPMAAYDQNPLLMDVDLDAANQTKGCLEGWDWVERMAENLANEVVTMNDWVHWVWGEDMVTKLKGTTYTLLEAGIPPPNIIAPTSSGIPQSVEDTPLFNLLIKNAGTTSSNFQAGLSEACIIPWYVANQYLDQCLKKIRDPTNRVEANRYAFPYCPWGIFDHLTDLRRKGASPDTVEQYPDFFNVFEQDDLSNTTLAQLQITLQRRWRALYACIAQMVLDAIMRELGTTYAQEIKTSSRQVIEAFANYFKNDPSSFYLSDPGLVDNEGNFCAPRVSDFMRSYFRPAAGAVWPVPIPEFAFFLNKAYLSPIMAKGVGNEVLIVKAPLGTPEWIPAYFGQFYFTAQHYSTLQIPVSLQTRGEGFTMLVGGQPMEIGNVPTSSSDTTPKKDSDGHLLFTANVVNTEYPAPIDPKDPLEFQKKVGYWTTVPLGHTMGADFLTTEKVDGGDSIRRSWRVFSIHNMDDLGAFVNNEKKFARVIDKTVHTSLSQIVAATPQRIQSAMNKYIGGTTNYKDILMQTSSTMDTSTFLTDCPVLDKRKQKADPVSWTGTEFMTPHALFQDLMTPANSTKHVGLCFLFNPKNDEDLEKTPENRPRASFGDNLQMSGNFFSSFLTPHRGG
jgi:hypothetical protein